ncbi:MAG TPA: hypothetical protein PKV48_00510 [Thermodesulfobacteriota bacterium]|nr:hypothetical protein [Thermodesulfobacteriota bacterium]
MSIIYELYKNRGKTVCPPNYTRVNSCPLILRTTSEDLLMANVFGILKNLNPHIWLKKFLEEALKQDFSNAPLENLSFDFWKRIHPPGNMTHKEGASEVDLIIRFDNTAILLEAKYLAPLSLSTTHCSTRNQLIRYIDIAINHFLYDAENPKDVYFVVLDSAKVKPWLIKYYRNPKRIFNEVTRSSMFADYLKACETIGKRIGWLNWERLRIILEKSKNHFLENAERKFIDDLLIYLEHKQNEAIRLRNERSVITNQFSLKL